MRILIAEDEKDMARALTAVLGHSGYETDTVEDGEAAVRKAASGTYGCMVFDIMMPKKDGIAALKEIRASGDRTPVIMLTAKAEIDDRITGLDAGADDYLTKPFAMQELLARIRSMTRRAGEFTPTKLTFGSVTLDTGEQELCQENSIRLGGKETRLMEFLMLNTNKEVSTEDIFQRVWSDEPDQDRRIVWIYVSYLRQKLGAIAADIEIDGDEGGSYILRKRG